MVNGEDEASIRQRAGWVELDELYKQGYVHNYAAAGEIPTVDHTLLWRR